MPSEFERAAEGDHFAHEVLRLGHEVWRLISEVRNVSAGDHSYAVRTIRLADQSTVKLLVCSDDTVARLAEDGIGRALNVREVPRREARRP